MLHFVSFIFKCNLSRRLFYKNDQQRCLSVIFKSISVFITIHFKRKQCIRSLNVQRLYNINTESCRFQFQSTYSNLNRLLFQGCVQCIECKFSFLYFYFPVLFSCQILHLIVNLLVYILQQVVIFFFKSGMLLSPVEQYCDVYYFDFCFSQALKKVYVVK